MAKLTGVTREGETRQISVPVDPDEYVACRCSHTRMNHGRLLIAHPQDEHIRGCGIEQCPCKKFVRRVDSWRN